MLQQVSHACELGASAALHRYPQFMAALMQRYGGHPYDTMDNLPFNVVDPVKKTPLENLWAMGHNRNELVRWGVVLYQQAVTLPSSLCCKGLLVWRSCSMCVLTASVAGTLIVLCAATLVGHKHSCCPVMSLRYVQLLAYNLLVTIPTTEGTQQAGIYM